MKRVNNCIRSKLWLEGEARLVTNYIIFRIILFFNIINIGVEYDEEKNHAFHVEIRVLLICVFVLKLRDLCKLYENCFACFDILYQ